MVSDSASGGMPSISGRSKLASALPARSATPPREALYARRSPSAPVPGRPLPPSSISSAVVRGVSTAEAAAASYRSPPAPVTIQPAPSALDEVTLLSKETRTVLFDAATAAVAIGATVSVATPEAASDRLPPGGGSVRFALMSTLSSMDIPLRNREPSLT